MLEVLTTEFLEIHRVTKKWHRVALGINRNSVAMGPGSEVLSLVSSLRLGKSTVTVTLYPVEVPLQAPLSKS